MNPKGSFWFKKAPLAITAELSGAIEVIPQAVLVVDSNSQRILAANTRAIELTHLSSNELSQLTQADLIEAGEDHPLNASIGVAPFLAELKIPGQTRQDIYVQQYPLTGETNLILVTLQPATIRHKPAQESEVESPFWQGLYLLASAAEQVDFDQRIRTALDGAQHLAQCDLAGLYLCKNQDASKYSADHPTIPLANRNATRWGDDPILPEVISPQDLVQLRAIRVWENGKRPQTNLHRTARNTNLSYLCSAPLGLPNSLTGLLVLGDKDKETPRNILRLLQFLAALFAYILDDHERRSQMQRTIEGQALKLRVLYAALDAVQDGVLVLSPDLNTRRINQAAETIFGYKNREIENQPINHVLIGSDAIEPALSLAQQGKPSYQLNDVNLLRRYGDPFQALARIQPILYDGGVESILVVIRDLSEQAEYEARARQLAQNAELGEVMSAFAHEVRNPINNISTGLQLMERSMPEGAAERETVHLLLEDMDRVENLMSSMLSVARTPDIKLRPLDLGGLLKNLIDRRQHSIAREGISCRVNIEPALPEIYGDPRALEQIFNNLILNAVQAMKDRPESQIIIKVQSQHAAKGRLFVEASVADNGPGIPKENLDKIFQPFYTTKANGNGLGLPLAKRIVTAHKGSITVTSFPGGTVFHVLIPAIETSAKPQGQSVSENSQ